MPMNLRPNFNEAYIKANEMLIKSSVIQSFPFLPKSLVKEQSSIVCRSYKKAKKYGVDITDFGSESATIFRLGDKSIIFYDETKPEPHIAFSILHEFGHDRLGHDFTKKDEESYHRYEVETNFFVAQLLMPEQIIRELQRRGKRINRNFLQTIFGVSAQAADKRIETLAKTNSEWRSRDEKEFDDIILLRYADFLNKICPIQNYYDFEDEYARQQERYSWY
mgnify:FL=1